MANDDKKAQKALKKQQRAEKRSARKTNRGQMWQAFNMLRKEDKKLIPWMLITLLGTMVIFFLLGSLWNGHWWMLILSIPLGIVLALLVFTRRLESNMYDRMAGQQGAAGWALENMRNTMGVLWITQTGVAGTTQMDMVHRVVGNPGVVLVGEGNRNRLRPLMNQQRKRIDRILAGVPIYELYIGDGDAEDEVPLKKLQSRMLRFPRNYKKAEVSAISAKLEAIDRTRGGQMQGLPKGPLPQQAQNLSGMNRRMRRASQRKKK